MNNYEIEEQVMSELYDNYDGYYEDAEDWTCPDCGSKRCIRYMQANGQDDYDWVYECKECGLTETT